MSAQHTQGLMKVHTENADGWPLLMIGGRIVANVNAESGVDTTKAPSIAFKPMPAEANARRLVACWNAFDGLETEMVESMVNVPEFFFKHTELLALRGELLEALKAADKFIDDMLREAFEGDGIHGSALELLISRARAKARPGSPLGQVRDAIAKATGSPT